MESKDVIVPTDIDEIVIQRINEPRNPMKGPELFDETVRLLNEYIDTGITKGVR